MKRISFLIVAACLLMPLLAHADYSGCRRSTQWISVPLYLPVDSAGNNRPVTPDSAHVATWPDKNVGQVIYSATTTTLANFGSTCKVQRDTIDGVVYWVLSDSVANLNAGTTSRGICGMVTLWWKGAPFQTRFSLDVIADTLQNYLSRLDAAVTSRMASGAPVTLAAGQPSRIRDTTWKSLFAPVVAGSYADSLKAILVRVFDSLTVDMSNFNTSLDNDSGLVTFLRAIVNTLGTRPDSGTISRMIKRIVWGLPAGTGADSTTLAQRLASLGPGQFTKLVDSTWQANLQAYATAYLAGTLLRIAGDSTLWGKPVDLWNIPANTSFASGSLGELLRTIPYKIDSSMWVNGQRPGAKSTIGKHPDADTLYSYINGVLIWRQIYQHSGGYPGKSPDSTWTVGP